MRSITSYSKQKDHLEDMTTVVVSNSTFLKIFQLSVFTVRQIVADREIWYLLEVAASIPIFIFYLYIYVCFFFFFLWIVNSDMTNHRVVTEAMIDVQQSQFTGFDIIQLRCFTLSALATVHTTGSVVSVSRTLFRSRFWNCLDYGQRSRSAGRRQTFSSVCSLLLELKWDSRKTHQTSVIQSLLPSRLFRVLS